MKIFNIVWDTSVLKGTKKSILEEAAATKIPYFWMLLDLFIDVDKIPYISQFNAACIMRKRNSGI